MTFSGQVRIGDAAALVVLFGFAAIFYAVYLRRSWKEYAIPPTWRRFHQDPSVKAALAWMALSTGIALQNVAALAAFDSAFFTLVHALGSTITVWSAVCLMRALIGPPEWPPRTWLWVAVVAAAVAGIFVSIG